MNLLGYIVLVTLLFQSVISLCKSGEITTSGLYPNKIVVVGRSLISMEDAEVDALRVIPRNWSLDISWTSPSISCKHGPVLELKNGNYDCDWNLDGNNFKYMAAITKRDL